MAGRELVQSHTTPLRRHAGGSLVQSHTTPRVCREVVSPESHHSVGVQGVLVQSHTTLWVQQERGQLELLTWNRPPQSLLNRRSRLEVRYRVEQTSGGREFNRVPRNEQNVQNEGEGTGSGSDVKV